MVPSNPSSLEDTPQHSINNQRRDLIMAGNWRSTGEDDLMKMPLILFVISAFCIPWSSGLKCFICHHFNNTHNDISCRDGIVDANMLSNAEECANGQDKCLILRGRGTFINTVTAFDIVLRRCGNEGEECEQKDVKYDDFPGTFKGDSYCCKDDNCLVGNAERNERNRILIILSLVTSSFFFIFWH